MGYSARRFLNPCCIPLRLATPLLLLALLLCLFWLWVPITDNAVEGLGRQPSSDESDGGAPQDLILGPTPRESIPAEPAGSPEPPDDASQIAAPPEEQEPPGQGNLEAIVPVTIRVVDDTDGPVADASVTIWAMRPEAKPGGHYLYRGEQPFGETDREGRVELEHWEWVTIDGRTGAITLKVTHPEFVTFTGDVTLGPGEHVVRIERGATVVVTGWHGSKSNVIHDLKLQVDREAKLDSDAWAPLDDGRLATTRIPSGERWIVASHSHPELGRLSSTAESFTVGEVGWETLHLELHDPIDFVGRLDSSVPRPIVDGHVMLVLYSGGSNGIQPVLSQQFEAEIEPDGSFVLAGLRPGQGQIFALCRGWSSERALWKGDLKDLLPSTEVPQIETPYVVRMERTGTLAVTVLGPDGTPVVGATLHAWPNVRVTGVGSWMHPWREWSNTTGTDGLARIEDLPPTIFLMFGASAEGLRMTAKDRADTPNLDLPSGATASAEIHLETGDR